jgi:hypothetical protein
MEKHEHARRGSQASLRSPLAATGARTRPHFLLVALAVLPLALPAEASPGREDGDRSAIHGTGYLCTTEPTCALSFIRDATRVRTANGPVILAVGGSYSVSAFTVGESPTKPILWSSAATPGQPWELPDSADGTTLPPTSFLTASAITRDGRHIASRANYFDGSHTRRVAVQVDVSPGSGLAFSNPTFTTTVLGLPAGSNQSASVNMSDAGSVIYGFAPIGAFRWLRNVSGLFVVPTLPGFSSGPVPVGRAGVSSDGSIALLSARGDSDSHVIGYLYDYNSNALTVLSPLPGDTDVQPFAMTSDGQVVVGGSFLIDSSGSWVAGQVATWAAKGGFQPKPLGSPNPGWRTSGFGGITANGEAVVMTFDETDPSTGDNTSRPYLLNKCGFFKLEEVLSAARIDLSGWLLTFQTLATDVNSLAGIYGVSPDGRLVFGGAPHSADVIAGSATFGTEGYVAEIPKDHLKNYGGCRRR